MSGSQAHGGAHLPRVVPLLELMTREELVELNRIVVQRLRLMQEIEAHGQMMNLRVGQKVRFGATDGRLIRGTIVRHNRKSVTLVAEDGHMWRVSPSFLQADQEATE